MAEGDCSRIKVGVTLDKRRGLFLFSPPGFHGEATLIADRWRPWTSTRTITRTDAEIVEDNRGNILKISFLPFVLLPLLRAVEILLLSPSSFLSFSNLSNLRPLVRLFSYIHWTGFSRTKRTRSRWNSARTETNTATRLEHRPTTSLAAELFYRLTGRRSSKSKTRGSRAFLRRMRAFQQERSGGEKRIELEPLVFHPSSRGLDSGFISRNSEGADRLSIRR